MLEFKKRHYLLTKVAEAMTDSKQLFQLVGSLLGHKEDNPLPEATSDSALAEDFASFFHDKINNIRNRFSNIQPYKPKEKCNVPLLRKFTPISARQLEKTITSMPSKTCTLDIIPTARLKEVLGTILPSLALIVNKSLDQGTFYTDWKEALVKPLVKKMSLGTTMTNCKRPFLFFLFWLFAGFLVPSCPKCALVLGNGCERFCTSRSLLGSYIHQKSI